MAKNEPGDLSPEISESNSPELHLPNELPAREETEPSLSNSSITLNDEKHHWVKKLDFLIADQWFLIVLGILILISSQVQVPASQQAVKSTVIAYLCVAVSFFIFGCTISTRTLIDNYSKWKVHLFVSIRTSIGQYSPALTIDRSSYNVSCSLLLWYSGSSAQPRQIRTLWIPGYLSGSYVLRKMIHV